MNNKKCLKKVSLEGITIRKYRECDASEATRLLIESFSSKFSHLKKIDETVLYSLLKDLKTDRELIHSENYVAEINSEVVGIIGLRRRHVYRDNGYNLIELMKQYGIINVILVLVSLILMGLQDIRYNEVYIEHVAVSPKFRGKGIGTSLIEYCINEYKKLNKAQIITLNVAGDNKGSIKLYKKLGFEVLTSTYSILTFIFLGKMNWLYMEKKPLTRER